MTISRPRSFINSFIQYVEHCQNAVVQQHAMHTYLRSAYNTILYT